MLKNIRPAILRAIRDRQLVMTFVDVGSRNGILELKDVAPFVDVYGFEPNKDEFDKLITGRTDLAAAGGPTPPTYRSISLSPVALANSNGPRDFYITPSLGACGLAEPEVESLRSIVTKNKPFKTNLG